MDTKPTGLYRPLLERSPFLSSSCVRLLLVLSLLLLTCSSCALSGNGHTRCGILDLDGDAVYYEVKGEGPAVVLIHGGQMDCRIWDPQFEAFSRTNRVIRYDIRGYGKSSKPQKPYSSIVDLYCLLNHLEVSRATLVGLSLGGRIAIDFAIAHPEMVDAVVAVGPGLSGFSWSEDTVRRIGTIVSTARDRGVHAATELWLSDPYMIPAMERNGISARIRQITQDNGHVLLNNPLLERGLDPPAAGRLSEIHVPFLIVVGDRDVPDIHRITALLEKGVAGAHLETIAGAGHIVNMEAVAQFNRIVLDFLEERGQDKHVFDLAPAAAGS